MKVDRRFKLAQTNWKSWWRNFFQEDLTQRSTVKLFGCVDIENGLTM